MSATDDVIKINENRTATVGDTSCNRGWLRMVVQIIFGIITVASFILIVYMSLGLPRTRKSESESRCVVKGCRIRCTEAPFYGKFRDVISALEGADPNCDNLFVTLKYPGFENGTLKLDNIFGRHNVYRLRIIRGNMQYIPPHTFMSPFASNIRILSLEGLTITNWTANALVGLTALKELYIKSCIFFNIERRALQAIGSTLKTLSITYSGSWDPFNLSGEVHIPKLTSVDLSNNVFTDIIEKNTFSQLSACEVLYLNSCNITAIGSGTFDAMVNLRVLYLNNNLLVTIPTGLFDSFIINNIRLPSINLQENYWQCDCESNYLTSLSATGVLMVDPNCYFPCEINGKSFSDFEKYCNNDTDVEILVSEPLVNANSSVSLITLDNRNQCSSTVELNSCCRNEFTFRVISPVRNHACPITDINSIASQFNLTERYEGKADWITPNFFIKGAKYSVVQIESLGLSGYGLLWFQINNLTTIFCINVIPEYLRIFNIGNHTGYTFCRIDLKTKSLKMNDCMTYELSIQENKFKYDIILYFIIALACCLFGASCVYAVIHKNPMLLRGNKRVLFVKHRSVDALILPPKITLKDELLKEDVLPEFNKDIFTIRTMNKTSNFNFPRTKSGRSSKSSAPSYISALQPTADQLAEWRLKNLFNNNLTITSVNSAYSTFSSNFDGNPLYHSICQNSDKIYESLK